MYNVAFKGDLKMVCKESDKDPNDGAAICDILIIDPPVTPSTLNEGKAVRFPLSADLKNALFPNKGDEMSTDDSDLIAAPHTLSETEEKRNEQFKAFVSFVVEQLPEFYNLFNQDPTQATKQFPELWQSVLYMAHNLLAQEDLALERTILTKGEQETHEISNRRASHWIFKTPEGKTALSIHQEYDGRFSITSDFTKKTNRGFDYTDAAKAFFHTFSVMTSRRTEMTLQQALIWHKEGRTIRRFANKLSLEDHFLHNSTVYWREAFVAEDWYVERELPQA